MSDWFQSSDEIYYLSFRSAPTVLDCEELFTTLFDKEVDLKLLLNDVHFDEHFFVDHTLLSLSGKRLESTNVVSLKYETYRFMARCRRCSVTRPSYWFINNWTCGLTPLCSKCRSCPDSMPSITEILVIIDTSLFHRPCEASDVDIVFSIYKLNLQLALYRGLPFEMVIIQDKHDGELPSHAFGIAELLDMVHNEGPYRYISNGRQGSRLRYVCSQERRSGEEGQTKKRVRSCKKNFKCGGYVSQSITLNRWIIRIKHEDHHTEHVGHAPISDAMKDKIYSLATAGLSPFQILSNIRTEAKNLLLYQDIYNAWQSIMMTKFKRHEDPRESALLYITECPNLHVMHVQSSPYGLSFHTIVGNTIMKFWRVEELLIDSTFKTNKDRLELFTVIASCMGAGFPIAYFLLEAGTGNGLKSREESLTLFLSNLKVQFPRLCPSFFFTDKETSQIKAIKNIFNIKGSLCLWHMNRAIRKKFKELRKDKKSSLNETQESILNKLIDMHYFRSTMITGKSSEELLEMAKDELKQFFSHNPQDTEMKDYLLKNWYDSETWKLWGRRNCSKISLSRTTMKVESHWSVLKRLYLLPYNRPRLDLLVHIIATSVMNKYQHDYTAMYSGRKKPYWWKSFVLTWKKCSASDLGGQYHTDHQNFICSCPAWLRSQWFICKHLVHERTCPNYHHITIRRNAPFITIEHDAIRSRANVDDEEISTQSEQARSTEIFKDFQFVSESVEMNVEQDTHGREAIDSQKQRVVSLIQWLTSHIDNLTSDDSHLRQLKYVEDNVLSRIYRYRDNVERALTQRRINLTWDCPDTIHLP